MEQFTLETWTKQDYTALLSYLREHADLEYKQFHSNLVPGYPPEKIIGIRLPALRKLARQIAKGNTTSYFSQCKTNYYEEIMLKGMVTGLVKCKTFREFTALTDSFASLVDNWAICDSFCNGLKQTTEFMPEFFEHIQTYLRSENPWHVRVGLIIMLSFYLQEAYIEQVISRTDSIKSDFYYVQMAQAWLLATAYAKFPQQTHAYLEHSNLDDWTYNKTIQKARESNRIDKETKDRLNAMKRKPVKNS